MGSGEEHDGVEELGQAGFRHKHAGDSSFRRADNRRKRRRQDQDARSEHEAFHALVEVRPQDHLHILSEELELARGGRWLVAAVLDNH